MLPHRLITQHMHSGTLDDTILELITDEEISFSA